MARKNEISLLKRIAAIRDLQRAGAQAQAGRAAAALREKQSLHGDRERRRQSIEDGWAASLSTPPVQMETAALWSAALLQEDVGVRRASREVDTAAAELQRRTTGWHEATNRRDAAQDMARQAVKDCRHHREEAALQEAADRFAQRGSTR